METPLLNRQNAKDSEKPVSFQREFCAESKKLWKLAGPAIFTSICQYSLGALTQIFAGFVGDMELAAVAVENSVIAGLAFGVMVIFRSQCFYSVSFCICVCFFVFFLLHEVDSRPYSDNKFTDKVYVWFSNDGWYAWKLGHNFRSHYRLFNFEWEDREKHMGMIGIRKKCMCFYVNKIKGILIN